MEPEDFDTVTDLFVNSTLRHLGRREEYVLRSNAACKEKDLSEYNLDRKERSKLNGYEGPRKFCDSFHRFETTGNTL